MGMCEVAMTWRCRFGLHDWVYIVSKDKVAVGRRAANRADYKVCMWCETVKDL